MRIMLIIISCLLIGQHWLPQDILYLSTLASFIVSLPSAFQILEPQSVFFLTSQYILETSIDREDDSGRSSINLLLFLVVILTVECTEQEVHSLSLSFFFIPLFDTTTYRSHDTSLLAFIFTTLDYTDPKGRHWATISEGASCLRERMRPHTEIFCHWLASSREATEKTSSWLETDNDLDGPGCVLCRFASSQADHTACDIHPDFRPW